MPEAFVPLTDFVNESKSIPRDHPLDKPVAKWIEEEVLDGEVVEAGVVILRTRGCYWSIKEGCSMCGYFNDTVPGGVSDDMLREQWRKVRPILKGKKYEHIVFSYHGIPKKHIKISDITKNHCKIDRNCCSNFSEAHKYCYRHQCYETTNQVAQYLNLNKTEYTLSLIHI